MKISQNIPFVRRSEFPPIRKVNSRLGTCRASKRAVAELGALNAPRGICPPSSLQHLQVSPLADHDQELVVTVLDGMKMSFSRAQ